MPSIFKDPIEWAQKAASTKTRYRIMQILTVLGGLALFIFIILLALPFIISLPKPIKFILPIVIGLTMFVFTVEMPLCYLKVIRHLLEKLREIKNSKN